MYTYFESSDPWGKLNWQSGESFIELALSALILLYVYFWPISYLLISGKETTYRAVPCRTIRNTIIKVAIDSISIDQARLLDKHLHNWGRDWVESGERLSERMGNIY